MAHKKLTIGTINALECPPGKDREFLWDTVTRGFGVRAMAAGSKSFVIQFRQNLAQHRMTIGEVGRIDLEDARDLAKIYVGAVAQGKDPIAERMARQQVRTLREVAEDFMRLHVAAKKKDRTHEEYGRLLRLHLYPALGSRPITSISKADMARLHNSLSDRPSAGNRCLALFDTVWHWAAGKGEISGVTPTKGLERNQERNRERYLTGDELRRLGQALRDAETTGVPWLADETGPKAKHLPKSKRATVVDPHAVAAIRLLMLTGARLREILNARWDYIDWERGLMFLPDSKTGRKTLYLSDVALNLLETLPRVAGNPHIIPGSKKGEPRADLKRPWAAIARAAGLVRAAPKPDPKVADEGKKRKRSSEAQPSVRLHDLRHTFAATGAGSSLGLPVIGKLLGHSQARTTQRYAHLDADPMHKAANLIGSQIAAAMNEAPTFMLPAHKPKKS